MNLVLQIDAGKFFFTAMGQEIPLKKMKQLLMACLQENNEIIL